VQRVSQLARQQRMFDEECDGYRMGSGYLACAFGMLVADGRRTRNEGQRLNTRRLVGLGDDDLRGAAQLVREKAFVVGACNDDQAWMVRVAGD
jgi:hypothetical protein